MPLYKVMNGRKPDKKINCVQNFKTIMASTAILLCFESFITAGESRMKPLEVKENIVAKKLQRLQGLLEDKGLDG